MLSTVGITVSLETEWVSTAEEASSSFSAVLQEVSVKAITNAAAKQNIFS